MTAAGRVLAPTALPRSAALTDLLLCTDGPGGPANTTVGGAGSSGPEVDAIRRHFEPELARAVRRRPDAPTPWRITGYAVRRAVACPGSLTRAPAFRWSATTARRPIGLAALRECLAGTARTPAEAVAATVASLAADGRHGLGRAGSLTAWAGRLAAPALAIVQAEATTWATELWMAVVWPRLGPGVRLGGPTARWSSASCPAGSLQGRVDVRVASPGGGTAFLTVLPGAPGPGSREELGLAALVAALAVPADDAAPATPSPVPRRVAGWWPDCGRALVVPVDHRLLEETCTAVLRAVAVLTAGPSPGAHGGDRGPLPGR